MSKALSQFHEGMRVQMACYHKDCDDVSIPASLGKEFEVHSSFAALGGVGRFHWQKGARIRSFAVANQHGQSVSFRCTNVSCLARFVHIIIVSMGSGRKPIIFGYESEGA